MVVPDVEKACERFEKLGVEFVKKPNDGMFILVWHYIDYIRIITV